MHPETALLFTIAGAFGAAFLFGFIASKLKMPPLVGYLLAGIALGPHSPGFIGNVGLASQLAEIGVILLMFGVGLHFSPGDLMRVRRIALPGATLQMLTAIGLGYWLASSWGWTPAAALVFGLSLSVASTVVVLRVLTPVVEPAMGLLRQVWAAWRQGLWQLPGQVPRLWNT